MTTSRVWNGTAWADATAVRTYNGTAWVDNGKGALVHDGSSWVPMMTGGPTIRGVTSAVENVGTVLTLTVPVPAGVVAGDVLVCAHAIPVAATTIPAPPAGWTALYEGSGVTGLKAWLYWRLAGASEPASHTWTKSGSGKWVATMVAVAKSQGAVAASVGINNTVATTIASSPLDVAADTALLNVNCSAGLCVITPDPALTDQLNLQSSTGGTPVTMETATGYAVLAGTAGPFTATSSTSNRGIAYLVGVT